MQKGFYQKMISHGAHASAPFQQKILIEWLQSIADKAPFKTALDIGSGLGFNLSTLAQFCSHIWAIDISPAALKEAKKSHQDVKNIKYLICDAQNLKFPDGKFDLAVCTAVLEHVEDQKRAVLECYRVLKPEGFLIISTSNYLNLTGLIKWHKDKKAGREYWDPWGVHKQGLEKRMTPGILSKLLSNRFQILETRGVNYLLAWFYFTPQKFYNYFPLFFLGKLPILKKFGMEYYILARKK